MKSKELTKLYWGLTDLLSDAPDPDDCPDEDEELYAEMKNLWELLHDRPETGTDARPEELFEITTGHGMIRAKEYADGYNDEYHGVFLLCLDDDGQEQTSILLEDNGSENCMMLHVWGYENPDGDPVIRRPMSEKYPEKEETK